MCMWGGWEVDRWGACVWGCTCVRMCVEGKGQPHVAPQLSSLFLFAYFFERGDFFPLNGLRLSR